MPKKRREFIKKILLAGIGVELAPSIMRASEQLGPHESTLLSIGEQHGNYWERLSKKFPLLKNYYYFNNAALGSTPNCVSKAVHDCSVILESTGATGHHLVQNLRTNIASFLGANATEIALIRNATEGMNIVANGIKLEPGDEIVITTHEHVSGTMPWVRAAQITGAKIVFAELDLSGEANYEKILALTSAKTKVIVFSHVTCTTGMVLPVKRIASWCRKNNVYACVDGAQAAGMISVDLHDLEVDFYTTCGHKWLYGPKETGMLYVSERNLKILGGGYVGAYSDANYDAKNGILELKNEASRYEYGTRNTALIVGLGRAVDFIKEIGIERIQNRGAGLKTYLHDLLKDMPEVEIFTPNNPEFSASILTFRLKTLDYKEAQKLLITKYQIRIRGIYENEINGIRVSCACYNSKTQIDILVAALKEIMNE